MRSPLRHAALPVALLVAGCGTTAPTEPTGLDGAGSSATAEAADASCTVPLHAVLREAGSVATVGQVQFRIDPPASGSDNATVQYWGVFGPTGDLMFDALTVALVSRIPGQNPTWTDIQKTDPGQTVSAVLEFGRVASMSQEMALALVDDPSSFKAVLNVVASTGGREAEGTVEPRADVPESLRDFRRGCFVTD